MTNPIVAAEAPDALNRTQERPRLAPHQPPTTRGGYGKRLWAIVAREIKENLRQRWLLATLGLQLGLIGAGGAFVLGWIDWLASVPDGDRKIEYWGSVLGMPMTLDGLVATGVGALDYLILTQLLGMTAVLAGHAALHDRQCGTLPFLLLAPVRRTELLAGKVVGAIGVPLMFYLALGGATVGWASTLPVAARQAAMLPPSGGFMVAFLLGAPAWSLCIGALCVAISSLAEDVRTAQQAAWVLVFVATFVVGPLLVNLMAAGAVVQGVVAAIGLALGGVSIGLATLIVSRELGR